MSHSNTHNLSGLHERLQRAKLEHRQLLKEDVPFEVLKKAQMKIRIIEGEIKQQEVHKDALHSSQTDG